MQVPEIRAPDFRVPQFQLAQSQEFLALPDAPGAMAGESSGSSSSLSAFDDPDPGQTQKPAPDPAAMAQVKKHSPHLQMTVNPGEIADPMTVHDKVVGGLLDSVSVFSATGWFTSAGWEQLWNSSPNYGTDAGAFGQRLGAAALRATSEGIFSDCLFAPLFREDPRYYVMGPGHPFIKRLFYSGTRAIITRRDSGSLSPNFSLIAGNLAGSALTIPYYPKINTSASQVMLTFGGSLGGSALGFVVDEFIVDALVDLHLKKKQ
jgi:hypothetical protein